MIAAATFSLIFSSTVPPLPMAGFSGRDAAKAHHVNKCLIWLDPGCQEDSAPHRINSLKK
jgi:hypothetical protein